MDRFHSLLERARHGDRDALGQLLDCYRDRLCSVADRDLRNDIRVRADPSDVVQMTILSALCKFDDFAGVDEEQFHAWLEQILERNLQDTIRLHVGAKKRTVSREVPLDSLANAEQRQPLHSAERTVVGAVIQRETAEWLITQIEALPTDQALAVRMRHLEGRELEEIALIMGRTKLAVAGLIKRGLECLRQVAGNIGSEES